MGNLIGLTKDRIVVLLANAMYRAWGGRNCLVVLNNVDRMFFLSNVIDLEGGNAQYHVGRRCKALFATILDTIRGLRFLSFPTVGTDDRHLLLLCTVKLPCGEVADQFDHALYMGRPNNVSWCNG
jgi:hypothetical protein